MGKKYNMYLYDISLEVGIILLLINKFSKIIEVLTNSFLASNYIYWLGILLVILAALLKGISCIEILLIIYGCVSFILIHDATLFSFLVLTITVKKSNMDNILRLFLRIQVLVLSICIIVYPVLLELGSPYAKISYITGRSVTRYNFFFSHPNNFAIQCVFTVLAYIYLYRDKLSYYKTNIIILFLILFLLIFPKSQTAVIVLIIYLVVRFMIKYAKLIWKPFIKFLFPIISVCISILVYMNYKGMEFPFLDYITGTFSARFSGAAMSFHIYKVNLFGNYLNEIGNTLYIDGQWNTFWFDLAYIRMLVAFGIVGAFIFYYIFLKGLIMHMREKNYMVLSLLVVVMVYAISEWTAFSTMTVFPLLFCNIVFQSEDKNSNIKKIRIKMR